VGARNHWPPWRMATEFQRRLNNPAAISAGVELSHRRSGRGCRTRCPWCRSCAGPAAARSMPGVGRRRGRAARCPPALGRGPAPTAAAAAACRATAEAASARAGCELGSAQLGSARLSSAHLDTRVLCGHVHVKAGVVLGHRPPDDDDVGPGGEGGCRGVWARRVGRRLRGAQVANGRRGAVREPAGRQVGSGRVGSVVVVVVVVVVAGDGRGPSGALLGRVEVGGCAVIVEGGRSEAAGQRRAGWCAARLPSSTHDSQHVQAVCVCVGGGGPKGVGSRWLQAGCRRAHLSLPSPFQKVPVVVCPARSTRRRAC
jgi:hypothetical protein